METPNVTITTVNIDFTTPELKDPQLDRLKEYFAGMETVLKLIIAIQNNENERSARLNLRCAQPDEVS